MSQYFARQEGHNRVADVHVEDAYKFLLRTQTRRAKYFDFGAGISGIIIGLGAEFLVTEITRDAGVRVGYAISAFIITVVASIVFTYCLVPKV